jgi:hypothetical protein
MERAAGLASIAATMQQSIFQFPSDEVLFESGDSLFAKEVKRWRLLRRALREFDVIHYNFGQPLICPVAEPVHVWPPARALRTLVLQPVRNLLGFADVAWLKRAGKAIVVTYQGDDARQGDYSLRHYKISIAAEAAPGYYTPATDALKRDMIARFARHADRIYAVNPDLLNVLPAKARFLPYANIDLAAWQPSGQSSRKQPRVLHAPSHRGAKGTRYLLDAVERLRAEGIEFELELVEGLSHEEARKRFDAADLVVDQLLAGWYGGFAVEVMALGKPVVAYLREDDLRHLPEAMRHELPVISAEPGTIYTVLRSWLTDRRAELFERGRASRSFVERWHDAGHIARFLAAEYRAALDGQTVPAEFHPAGA